MFVDIETFLFNALVDAQAVQLLDAVEQGESTGGSPEVDDQDAKALSTEESPAVTVEGVMKKARRSSARRLFSFVLNSRPF